MAQPKLRNLPQFRRELVETAAALEALHRTDLHLRGAAGPDEVRVIRVRQPVRSRLRGAHDLALLERDHRVARARSRKHISDRAHPFRVRHRMPPPVEDAELSSGSPRDRGDELRTLPGRAPNLEVRRARP